MTRLPSPRFVPMRPRGLFRLQAAFAGVCLAALVLAEGARAAAGVPGTEAVSPSAEAECYRLAGEPFAPPAFKGVALDDIEPDPAIKACESARAQNPKDAMLADLIGRAYQARGDFENARRFFEEASRAGNAYGKANLAWFLIEGAGGAADVKEGLSLLLTVAADGNVLAQYTLGTAYREGRAGLQANAGEAIFLLQKAADQGHAVALYDLAILFRDGDGVAVDLGRSLALLEKAAGLGDVDSMAALGYAYEQGLGTAVDFELARTSYQKAADNNQIDAMTNLGRLYEAGEGVAQDYARAFGLYQAAAAGGSPIAMANLANLYEFGIGTDPSPKDAAYWLARAIMAGNMDALGSLVDAPQDYSPDVLSQLQTFLLARGLYGGPIDGAMNGNMAAALRKLPGEQP